MTKLFLLFSHNFTEDQKKDAKESLGVTEFVSLPDDLQEKFSNINPNGELDIKPLREIARWLEINADDDDFVLIQGEFGTTFYLVDFCFKRGFEAIYATSERVYEEAHNDDGTVERKHIFKHVNFRRYVKP